MPVRHPRRRPGGAGPAVSGVVRPTPLEYSRALSDRVGCEVYLKCENLQRAGSFKIRGAYTRMARLTDEEKARGVVAASAGNHAQGVALAGQLLGIDVKVYMPHGAPMPKLHRDPGLRCRRSSRSALTIDECLVAARAWEAETGAVLIHPFDHHDIVAGQGTAGLEILDQCPDVKTIVVSTGGGGLLAGISVAVKAAAPGRAHHRGAGRAGGGLPVVVARPGSPSRSTNMQTMADGIAVGMPGDVPYALVRELVDGMETVTRGGAVARAAVPPRAGQARRRAGGRGRGRAPARTGRAHLDGPVVAVLSGGNIDPILLLRIIRHGMAAAGRYLQFRVRVPDRPGHLARLLADCAAVDANVLEVEHIRTGTTITVDEVEIGPQLETRGPSTAKRCCAPCAARATSSSFG